MTMKGNIVSNLNNAMFALGAARIKLRNGTDKDDIEGQLADITNQIRTIADAVWEGSEIEQMAVLPQDTLDMALHTEIIDRIAEGVGGNPILTNPCAEIKLGQPAQVCIQPPPSDAAYKMVDKLFFKAKSLGYESINPAEIIGKTCLLTFNTNTRQMAIYIAADRELGLQVKGSTMKNFDTSLSTGKNIRENKVQSLINRMTTMDKDTIRYEYSKVNSTEKVLTGRINKHILLLRAW